MIVVMIVQIVKYISYSLALLYLLQIDFSKYIKIVLNLKYSVTNNS